MAQQTPAINHDLIGKLLLLVACILFVIASLAAGGVIKEPAWAFGFGALAAWALSGVI